MYKLTLESNCKIKLKKYKLKLVEKEMHNTNQN